MPHCEHCGAPPIKETVKWQKRAQKAEAELEHANTALAHYEIDYKKLEAELTLRQRSMTEAQEYALKADKSRNAWATAYEEMKADRDRCLARIVELETAIKRALDDEESGTGWGPDVTVCAYLRDALAGGEP
jgi:glycyl-tRNA synthetase alpha subunit